MHVLTAGTVVDQPGDFAHTIPGELVRLSSVCDRDRYDPTGPCGCGRAFVGVASGKSTSVAVVADLDMTVEEYRAMLRRAGVRSDDPRRRASRSRVRPVAGHAGTPDAGRADDMTLVSPDATQFLTGGRVSMIVRHDHHFR